MEKKMKLNLHVEMDRELDKGDWSRYVGSYLETLGITYLGSSEQSLEPISESPVEPISEKNVSDGNKPRPTGEEELKRLEDWLVREICMKPSERKRIDKELIKRGEFEVETRKRVKSVLSLAREEGKKEGIFNDSELRRMREVITNCKTREDCEIGLDMQILEKLSTYQNSLSNQSKGNEKTKDIK